VPQERLSNALAHMADLQVEIRAERDLSAAMLKLVQKVPSSPGECIESEAKLRKLFGQAPEIQDGRVREAAVELLSALDESLERSRQSFLREFRDQAKARGIEVELRDSVFLSKALRVFPDLAKGRCGIRFGEEVVEEGLPLDASRCLDALTKHSKRLLSGREAPGKILAALHESYLGVCGQREVSAGKSVPIIDVLNQMVLRRQPAAFRRDPASSRFVEYTRADFSADLFLLRSSRTLAINGKRLHLQTAVIDTAGKPARSISVPSDDGRSMTYFQALAFQSGGGGR
jgi:hypothetical protein